MSLRKSNRERHPPNRYSPENANNPNENDMAQNNEKPQSSNGSTTNNTSTSSRRRLRQLELEKIGEMNRLEKLHEEKEMQLQREFEQKELERQRLLQARELERQKRLLEAKIELESASVCSSQHSVSGSHHSKLKVGLNLNLEEEVGSHCKVERWLEKKEPTVLMSSPAVETTAVQRLADSIRNVIQPASFQKQLPTFSGKPDEWPMFFSAYEKTVKLYSEDDNLVRLRNCLEGEAFKMVKPLFVSSNNLNAIVKTLQMRFGRPEFIIESMMNQTKSLAPVKEDNIVGLIEFSTTVLNFTSIAKSLHMESYLTNPQLLNELLGKLPYHLKYNWAQHLCSISLDQPTIHDFSSWLEKQCSIMSIYFRPSDDNLVSKKKNDFKPVLTNSSKETVLSCGFCSEKHASDKCRVFRKADVSQRWKMVGEKKLCFACFSRHPVKFCKIKSACGINGCKLYHHRLLHNEKLEKKPAPTTNQGSVEKPTDEVVSNHIEGDISNQVLLRVCPVTLYGPKSQVDTYALLDDGSTVSLLDSSIADELGIEGEILPLTTCWSNTMKHHEPCSRKLDVKIKGFYEENTFTLSGVRTQSRLNLPHQVIDSVKTRKNWPHLDSISQPLPIANVKPTLLIGQDNCHLILTRKIIEGPTNAPVLSWCFLGWTLHGKCRNLRNRVDDNFTLLAYEKSSLHDLVKESFEIERYGETQPEKTLSEEEERAVSILETTTKKTEENRYEVGLLWKSDSPEFPPSYNNALKRLTTLEKKMDNDPIFKRSYTQKLHEYEEKGYIRKLSNEEANVTKSHTFYLPHFGVTNPNKPNKLRLVFDAAAKSHGVSFNDALLSGPDYLNPLPSVLLKFRLKKIAIVGDIKEMFHQVQIREEDVDSQRFLWRTDKSKQPDTYIMKAMTFGSTCSPSSALFVVKQNTRHFLSMYPEASNSILTKEYMDDLLDSTDTEEEAMRRVKEITEIHKSGGFQICNWISNSKEVLAEIPDSLKTSQAKQMMSETKLPTERVLGMWWEAETDNFVFHRNADKFLTLESSYPTKREVLRAAMSIFDPLGLVVPTTIKGRMLVQDIWRTKITWDEVLPVELTKKWQDWLEEVKSIQCLKIPRCYFETSTEEEIELHTFVDASEEAYSAVAYLRQKSLDQSHKTVLVFSRAKVTPLKPTTIPRLELQAAVLGCRLAHSVEQDIGINIARRVFWSDSVTVLHWIKADPRTFKQFVANRIGEVQELSKTEEWRWVPTKQNPADIATRSSGKFTSKAQQEWIYGPKFLELETDQWPEQPMNLQTVSNDETKKLKFVGLHKRETEEIINIDKFSSWEKLTRVVTWVLRYVKKLKSRIESPTKVKLQVKTIDYTKIPEILPEEILITEKLIIKMTQNQSFEEEKSFLAKGKPLPKSSQIFSLSPFLDEKGLVKMSSRTCHSPEMNEENKQPYIIDGKSQAARLIIKMMHEKCFHQGIQTVMNMTRQRFWITNLRTLVKQVQRSCMRCRIDNAKPNPPQMAPLPITRVTRVEHPFFYTGIDYFGPIEVTVGRRHEKRYGVLFTCLSTRAVHLEVAHSLNTESCVMAIQRFVSRKPCPSEMFSDNGTNFVATEKELRTAIKSLNHSQIQRSVSRNGIKWNFIPPRAPHMGGCWERLIRSVKTALRSVMKSQFPKDEELQTFLVRVEFIINSRPLTDISIDPQDPDPITPNHFLREAFKIDINENVLCKRQLARVRTLLDNFWKRWIREYLPCLARRCKWHTRTDPPQVGDLAIMVDENSARNTWPIGRISKVYLAKDGQARIVDITTSSGTFRRPVTKVAVLSVEGEKML